MDQQNLFRVISSLRKRLRFFSAIFIPLAAIILTLGLAEFGLAFFKPINYGLQPPRFSELPYQRSLIPGLDYELRSNVKGPYRDAKVSINRFGMRDDDPVESPHRRILRIVALGDSFTFGFGVEMHDTYPYQLEKILQSSARRTDPLVDVLNFGVGGYSTQEEVILFEHRGLQWNPELVIMGYCLNDPDPEPNHTLHWHFAPGAFWQRFQITRLMAQAKYGWDSQHYGQGNYVRYVHKKPEKWQTVVQGFERLRQLTAPKKIPVIIVIFPLIEKHGWDAYEYEAIHLQVANEALKNDFYVIDLLPSFKGYTPAQMRVSNFDGHPSPLAHHLAAEQIKALIQRDRLLNCCQL